MDRNGGKQTFGPPWILFKYFIICQIKRGLQIVIKGAEEKALKAKGFPKVENYMDLKKAEMYIF